MEHIAWKQSEIKAIARETNDVRVGEKEEDLVM